MLTEPNAANDKVVTHDFPVWRDRADFIIAARLGEPDVPEKWTFEQLWAKQIAENLFEVCCIPLFLYGIALGDQVSTKPFNGRTFVVNAVSERMGHTTFRIWFTEMKIRELILGELHQIGCLTESRWERSKLVSIDAPNEGIRETLERYLRTLQSTGGINFENGM